MSAPPPMDPAEYLRQLRAKKAQSAAPPPMDPQQYLEQLRAQKAAAKPREPDMASPTSRTGAALRGFGNGASLGFIDELAGLANGAVAAGGHLVGAGDDFAQKLGMRGMGEGVMDSARRGYLAGRNDTRRENETAKQVQFDGGEGAWWKPAPFGLGGVAGSLALPVGAAKTGLKGMAMAKNLARTGAMMGAASGLGSSEADLVDGARAQKVGGGGRLLLDTAMGGAAGAVLAPAIGVAAEKGARKLADWSAENFARAGGLAPGISNRAEKAGLDSVEGIRAYGNALKRMDLIKPLDTPEDVLKRGLAEMPTVGAGIDGAIAGGDALGAKPDIFGIAAKARWNLQNGATSYESRTNKEALQLIKDIEDEAANGPGTFEAANRLKQKMYAGLSNLYQTNQPKLTQEMQKDVLRTLKEGIADELEKASPELAQQLATSNKMYGTLLTLKKLAQNESTRDVAKNKLGSLVSAGLGAGIGASGGPLGASAGAGAGLALGNAVGRYIAPRLPALVGTTQRALQPALPRLATPAARAASPALADYLAADPTDEEEASALARALRRR